MQQAFDDLYNLLVMSPAGNELEQQNGERMYAAAVKEAFRQLLKVSQCSAYAIAFGWHRISD